MQTVFDILLAMMEGKQARGRIIGMLPHHICRIYHVFFMFKHCQSVWPIAFCAIAWMIAELIRYPFYTFKS